MTELERGTLSELCQQAAELARAADGYVRVVRLRAGECSVEVEWQAPAAVPNEQAPALVPENIAAQGPREPAAPAREPVPDPAAGSLVKAPLVGTFYRAPSPGAQPFVEAGSMVEAGQQVAIIEAMKLMNAVTAEVPGRVVEILVADATPVEYGEPLMVVAAS